MYKFKTLGVSWPPQGWDNLNEIKCSTGQAILKDPVSALISGVCYTIESLPVHLNNNECAHVYAVHVDGWDYNIYNESCEYPILSFIFQEKKNAKAPKYYYMSDIKTRAQSVPLTKRSAHRSYMAALCMMKQIEAGRAPDFERILRLYKMHPSQRYLYEVDYERHDSLFCGLVERSDKQKNTEAL